MKRAALFAIAAALVASRSARADVRVVAPDECAGADRVRARIVELAGGAPLEAVDAEVVLTREGPRVRARITLVAPSRGERTLVASDCDSALESAALVIAMSARARVDAPAANDASGASLASVAPAPAAAPAVAPSARPTDTRSSAPPSAGAPSARSTEPARASRGEPVGVHLALLGSGGIGVLPSASAGGALVIGVRVWHLRTEIDAGVRAGQRAEARAGVGGDFSSQSLAARACFDFARTRLELAPCVGIAADRIAGAGFGAAVSTTTGEALRFGPTAGALGSVALAPWLAIRASIEASLAVSTETFVIKNVGPIYRPSTLAGRVEFGPEVRF
jgi:hypothetical protein